MAYKAVGFDRTGVIVGETAVTFNTNVSNIIGVTVKEFITAYRKYNSDFNTGKITTLDLWKKVLHELNKEQCLEKVLNLVNKPKEVNLDVINLIKELKNLKFKVGLLSNDKPEAAKIMREVEHLDTLFDVMCISSETGLIKPNKDAYFDFISKLEIKPNQLIFIDDSQLNLDNAKDLGVSVILCTNHADIRNQLKGLGVL